MWWESWLGAWRGIDRRRKPRRPPTDLFGEVLQEVADQAHRQIRARRVRWLEEQLSPGIEITPDEVIDFMLEPYLREQEILEAEKELFRDHYQQLALQYELEDQFAAEESCNVAH